MRTTLICLLVVGFLAPAAALGEPAEGTTSTIYGFAMLDMGYNANQIDPNWYDTLRVTKLPWYENQFGKDGSTFAGVRQSRLG